MSREKYMEIMFGTMALLSQALTGFCPAAMLLQKIGVRSERELARGITKDNRS
jgi:hypothetical protein